MSRRRHGFSIFDLLVILAVLAILIGLLLPAVQKVREAANRMKCVNNLKQVGLACHNAHESLGYIPGNPDTVDKTKATAQYFLLPYLEQKAVYDLGEKGYDKRIPTYQCPSDPTTPADPQYAPGDYATNNLLFEKRFKFPDVTDGLSKTVLFGEKYARCSYWALTKGKEVPWYVATEKSGFQVIPANPDCELPQTAHPGAMNTCFGDGSVRPVSQSVEAKVWYALNTPNAGDEVPGD